MECWCLLPCLGTVCLALLHGRAASVGYMKAGKSVGMFLRTASWSRRRRSYESRAVCLAAHKDLCRVGSSVSYSV